MKQFIPMITCNQIVENPSIWTHCFSVHSWSRALHCQQPHGRLCGYWCQRVQIPSIRRLWNPFDFACGICLMSAFWVLWWFVFLRPMRRWYLFRSLLRPLIRLSHLWQRLSRSVYHLALSGVVYRCRFGRHTVVGVWCNRVTRETSDTKCADFDRNH